MEIYYENIKFLFYKEEKKSQERTPCYMPEL